MTDRIAFFRALLAECGTPPMTCSELADVFGLSRRKMATVLERMPGAERSGYFWTVPLRRMPVPWLLEHADQFCAFVVTPTRDDASSPENGRIERNFF